VHYTYIVNYNDTQPGTRFVIPLKYAPRSRRAATDAVPPPVIASSVFCRRRHRAGVVVTAAACMLQTSTLVHELTQLCTVQ